MSNFNSLSNQLGIYLILAKQEKLASNSLVHQLRKIRNLTKLTSPRAYMHARRDGSGYQFGSHFLAVLFFILAKFGIIFCIKNLYSCSWHCAC
jgi:hypothetical protein